MADGRQVFDIDAKRRWRLPSRLSLLVVVMSGAAVAVAADGHTRWVQLVVVALGGVIGLAFAGLQRFAFRVPEGTVTTGEPGYPAAIPARRVDPPGERYIRPRQLPPSPPVFAGRTDELDRAVAYLVAEPSIRPRLVVVRGNPGIGKTAFALRAGHAASSAFPDGQLYVTVGRDEGSREQVLDATRDQIIRALGRADQRPPTSPEQRQRELERLFANRRILLVIDDAPTAQDAADLIPAVPTCAVIVTTRDLTATISSDELIVQLEPLGDDDSLRILSEIAGPDRVSNESDQAREIVGLTAGLPLSVRTTAAGLAERPHGRLEYALRRLTEFNREQADTLTTNEDLDLGYALLSEPERTCLRSLGTLSEDSFYPWKLATMAKVDERSATLLADRLSQAGFLEHTSLDSVGSPLFGIPQHIHRYAERRLREAATDDERQELIRRLDLAARDRKPLEVGALRTKVFGPLEQGQLFESINEARRAVEMAREGGDRVAEGLALAAFAEVRMEMGIFEGATDLAQAALQPSVRSDLAEAWALRIMGRLHRRLHQTDQAIDHLSRALPRCAGHPTERIRILRELALAQAQLPRGQRSIATATMRDGIELCLRHRVAFLEPALRWAESAVLEALGEYERSRSALHLGRRLAETANQRLWLAWLLFREARLNLAMGEYDLARKAAGQAIEDFAVMDHRYGKAHCRLALGEAYSQEGNRNEAVPLLEQALENFINCGDRWAEAEAMRLLAKAHGPEPTGEATRLMDAARRMFAHLGDVSRLERIAADLAASTSDDGRLEA